MRKCGATGSIAVTLAISVGFNSPAVAADPFPSWHGYPYQPPSQTYRRPTPGPYYAPQDYWSGAYIGGLIGYGFGTVDVKGDAGSFSFDQSGGTLGAIAGYNWRARSWIVGLEGEFKGFNLDGTHLSPALNSTIDVNWMGSLRARIGYLVAPALLIYATGGVAWTNYELNVSTPVLSATTDTTSLGWQAGVGAELKLTDQWSLRLDYLYTDLGNTDVVTPGMSNTYSPDVQTIQLGVTYRF
ncbi:MAG: porin family protein [Hyphomicrobiaceae bacterium]|nr:MAG: porin family protein [Hyphomicrobiaceae bacterium]